MNSCRNCRHSRHEGSINPVLYCTRTKRMVAPEISRSTRENLEIDARLRALAVACVEYKREE